MRGLFEKQQIVFHEHRARHRRVSRCLHLLHGHDPEYEAACRQSVRRNDGCIDR